MPQYAWGNTFGVIYTKEVDPQEAGESLKALREEKGDLITPQDVVDQARPRTSPTHKAFEWNNSVAGEKWRVHQGRFLLHSLRVVVADSAGDPQHIVANVHIRDKADGYMSIHGVVRNPEYLEKAKAEALRYIKGFQERFSMLESVPEFAPLFEIDAAGMAR